MFEIIIYLNQCLPPSTTERIPSQKDAFKTAHEYQCAMRMEERELTMCIHLDAVSRSFNSHLENLLNISHLALGIQLVCH